MCVLFSCMRRYPAVRDTKAAVRWVRAHAEEFGVDPGYITAYGESAGGATVVALGLLDEEDYKSEMTIEQDPTLDSTNLEQSSAVTTVLDHWGTDWMARQLMRTGPTRYSSTNAPIAIFHGNEDKAVPYALETARIVAGYNTTGVPYAFFTVQGQAHGAWGPLVSGQPFTHSLSKYDVVVPVATSGFEIVFWGPQHLWRRCPNQSNQSTCPNQSRCRIQILFYGTSNHILFMIACFRPEMHCLRPRGVTHVWPVNRTVQIKMAQHLDSR